MTSAARPYESGYKASRLSNWETGRSFPERPRYRRGATKVIADDRGHLLPGVARTAASPWGPLAQAIDPNVGERYRRVSEGRLHADTDCEGDDGGGGGEEEGNANGELQITGEALMAGGGGGGGGSAAEQAAKDDGETDRSSGSMTPASFRRRSRTASAMQSAR
ncbi:protein Flattop-like [Penaeus indicus]|uniref:protein Flattop-like n=1 Tax=Penaeus indicus TaxID=29960 RepID=UPI00300CD15C